MVPSVVHLQGSPEIISTKSSWYLPVYLNITCTNFAFSPSIVQLNKSFLDYKVHVSLEVPFGSSKNSFYFLSHSVLVFFFF